MTTGLNSSQSAPWWHERRYIHACNVGCLPRASLVSPVEAQRQFCLQQLTSFLAVSGWSPPRCAVWGLRECPSLSVAVKEASDHQVTYIFHHAVPHAVYDLHHRACNISTINGIIRRAAFMTSTFVNRNYVSHLSNIDTCVTWWLTYEHHSLHH